MIMGFLPYSGDEPYIFLSYAHDDTERIYKIAKQLHQDGYRIWYDEEVKAGEDHKEKISNSIRNASFMLCFVSPSYVNSDYCRRELSYAIDQRVTIIPVKLDKFTSEISSVDFNLTGVSWINAFDMEESEVIERIKGSPNIVCCKENSKAQFSFLDFVHNLKMLRWCLVLAVVLIIFGGRKVYVENQIKDDLQFSMQTITEEIIQQATISENIDSLVFYNCDFQLDSEFRFPYHIEEVRMYRCSNVETLAYFDNCWLERLIVSDCGLEVLVLNNNLAPYLKYLDVSNNSGLKDITQLKSFDKLEYLDVSGTAVSDLDITSEDHLSELVYLDFGGTPTEDISPIAECVNLEAIHGNNTGVADLSPLSGLTRLAVMEFDHCQLTLIDNTFSLESVVDVSLEGNQLAEIEFIRNCPKVESLNIAWNQINDLTPLEERVQYLKALNISHNPVDADELKKLKLSVSMQELLLDGIPMTELIDISNMARLKYLSASGCGMQSISSLESFQGKLEIVSLSNNRIEDLSPLQNTSLGENSICDLGYNQAHRMIFKGSNQYRLLVLVGNPLAPEPFDGSGSISALHKIRGDHLVIQYYGAMNIDDWEPPQFEHYTVVDCPEDIQSKVAKLFDSGSVQFCSSGKELEELMEVYGLNYSFLRK